MEKSPLFIDGELSNKGSDLSFLGDEDAIAPRGCKCVSVWRLIAHAASRFKNVVVNCICTRADVLPPSLPEPIDAAAIPGLGNGVDGAPLHSHHTSQPVQTNSQFGSEQRQVADVSSDAKPRLFALLIGINEYKHAGSIFQNLKGAVADAEDMSDFLTSALRVDPSHICILRDQQATRRGIIAAFSALISDKRIQRGDAIVIFYAGHGSRIPASSGSDAKELDARGMIIPHNFLPEATSDVEQQGIRDTTLANLLWKLANEKGDNITVIFDSCHSGSSTHHLLELDVEARGFTLPADYTLPEDSTTITTDLTIPQQEAVEDVDVASGYKFFGSASHMLLAACSRTEAAIECNGRGFFSLALLTLLRKVDWRNLTYSDLIKLLPDRPNQHPQCEGDNSQRVLFNCQAPDRSSIVYTVVTKTAKQGQVVTLDGGEVHGITEGALFDVFATRDFTARPLFCLVAKKTYACSADLGPLAGSVEQEIPQPAWALQAAVGTGAGLAVAVFPGPEFDDLRRAVKSDKRPNKRPIQFVDPCLNPDRHQRYELELQIEGNSVVFSISDPTCTTAGLTKLPVSVPLDNVAAIYAVLESAADFFFHLRRCPDRRAQHERGRALPIRATASGPSITLKAFQLQVARDAGTRDKLVPCSKNLVRKGKLHITITKDAMYGFKLKNASRLNLYVWAFMFNVSDLSIETLYKPNFAKTLPDPSLPGLGSLTIGYGSAGVAPREFRLPEGVKSDVAFLKVFVSSEPVDLSYIAQPSAFNSNLFHITQLAPSDSDSTRSSKQVELPQGQAWDSVHVAIVQKEKAVVE